MSMRTTGPQTPEQAQEEQCGQCGTPAAHDQRYCLNCGFHRRNAPDPVARYLSEASAARARVAAAEARAAERRGRLLRGRKAGGRVRLGLAPVTLLVALALLAGVLIGNATAGNGPGGKRAPGAASTFSRTTNIHTASPVRNTTGSSYVQQEKSLPNSVTP